MNLKDVNHRQIRNFLGWFAASLSLMLVSCSSAPARPVTNYTPTMSEKAANTAVAMIGRPYKYRGDNPEGFDCSGLVRYSYLAAGLSVPHGTKPLRKVTRPVSFQEIRKGDLLFFYERGKKNSHVGIYLEDDIFVHAPSSGGNVKKESLSDPHWKKSFLEARRFM
ncbi:MAG: C40 family peptidase [Betaproteobacteria bacterium]